ncbi:hypothetical protein [Brevibacillus choshinensis]|uniref:Uncharacterized protein n=1 Tax=Brevibacillus choshinensis TaxID=54911 RepID=A0ABX7FQU8_BRECH|nr:hypothetical protein [Brevibacillus choshinensis]QRG68611.1 hypothetical protein JNE38_05515 [Brevibacillus choshinensis]
MIADDYLKLVAQDIQARASTVLINNTTSVPVLSVTVAGKVVTVRTETVQNVTAITNLKLKTTDGKVIIDKAVNLTMPAAQQQDFTFTIEVKGGTA